MSGSLQKHWRVLWLALGVGLFLLLAGFQLGLPGLHYDEAREAGVNALELLSDAPVTAHRGAVLHLFGHSLPLMVQDYIGALNVYLAIPFLHFTGIGVPNLRFLALALALFALFFLERAISEWMALQSPTVRTAHAPLAARHSPISLAALSALTLLVASPSFVFWSRQGIFVTNATLPTTYFALWQGLRWVRTGSNRTLFAAAFAAGLALYAKLLAIWVIAPSVLAMAVWWWWRWRRSNGVVNASALPLPPFNRLMAVQALIAAAIPLLPLFIFNWQTGGTFQSVGNNLVESYYGVDNSALLANLPARLHQLVAVLRGEQFWYLGGLHANPLAPWLWLAVVLFALLRARSRPAVAPPLLLLGLSVLMSLFTVSDLFITHYALIHPLAVAVMGIALGTLSVDTGHWVPGAAARQVPPKIQSLIPILAIGVWLMFDLSATLSYHRDLARSGGLADHSDASYHLAYHLRYNGLGAPIALDWGLDAPVRYLSEGTVQPIEIFGYTMLDRPDDEFARRLGPFLENANNVYLLRAPEQSVFQGRRDSFFEQVRLIGRQAVLEQTFTQRDGTSLFELWRVIP